MFPNSRCWTNVLLYRYCFHYFILEKSLVFMYNLLLISVTSLYGCDVFLYWQLNFQFYITFILIVWEGVLQFFFSLLFLIFSYILQVTFWFAGASSFQTTMTDPLLRPTHAPSNLLLDLNLNMNLNHETKMHDNTYNVKYRQFDTLYKSMLFEPLKPIRESHTTFKINSFVAFEHFLKSFSSIEIIIRCLEEQLTNIVTNSSHKFMKGNLFMIIDQTPHLGVGVRAYLKAHYKLHMMFLQTHQEVFYLKEILQNIHSTFLGTLDHQWKCSASVEHSETTTTRPPTSKEPLENKCSLQNMWNSNVQFWRWKFRQV